MKSKRVILAITLWILLVGGMVFFLLNPRFILPSAGRPVLSEVAQEFICNCDCQKVLWDCSSTMKECSIGQNLTKLIGGKIDQGWSKKRIMDYMVKNYEEQVLAVPTKRGFNLTAWVFPFVAVAAGGILVYLAIVNWVLKTEKLKVKTVAGEKKVTKEDKAYKEKLEEELKKFEY